MGPKETALIQELATQMERVWSASTTTMEDRKTLLRYGVCVAAERKTGKLDFDVGRPDARETRIEVSGCSFLDIERL
jgi:hypothetical protein